MANLEKMIDLKNLPKTVKLFISLFIVCMGISYMCAIGNIALGEGTSIRDVADHYRGNADKMIEAPDMAYLMSHTHTHMYGMSLIVFTVGLIFLFTRSAPAWMKKFALVDGFVAVLIANASFWLIRYVAWWMAYLMVLSGMMLGLSMLIMLAVPLYEMWLKKANNPAEVREIQAIAEQEKEARA